MYNRSISILLILLSQFLNAQINCDIYDWQQESSTYQLETQRSNYLSYLDSLTMKGYYSLQIDSIVYDNSVCKAYIHKGKHYLDYVSDFELYSSKIKIIKDSLMAKGEFFNKITLSPNEIKDDKIIYDISIDSQDTRTIDNIKYVGYNKIPIGYTKTLLNNQKIANATNINKIENSIKDNKAIILVEPSKVSYTKDSTILYIYTKKQKASNFDGIVGFSTDENNKLKLNGNVNLRLHNTLNKLEQINLQWLGGEDKSQNLDFNFHFPYVLFKHIGIQSDLKIRKQDSTFLQLRWNNGLSYQINVNSFISTNFNIETSNYITTDNTNGEDYQKSGFGIGYTYHKDNSLNFNENKSGLIFNANLLNKTHQNTNITQSEITYQLERQQNIWKHHYLYGKVQGENMIQKDEEFLYNELYKLGGMNNLRGFNQNSLFTPSYNMLSLAYRYIPNNAFLLEVFSDFALLENAENDKLNSLLGLGSGIQFRSSIGIFKLMYAVGKSENKPFDFTNGKVHFGIETQF